jgi:hypothetical protein
MVRVARILTQVSEYSNRRPRMPGAAFKDFPLTITHGGRFSHGRDAQHEGAAAGRAFRAEKGL